MYILIRTEIVHIATIILSFHRDVSLQLSSTGAAKPDKKFKLSHAALGCIHYDSPFTISLQKKI